MATSTPTKCCPHRAADHAGFGGGHGATRTGSKCTVPNCKCLGWIPRKGTNLRGEREAKARGE